MTESFDRLALKRAWLALETGLENPSPSWAVAGPALTIDRLDKLITAIDRLSEKIEGLYEEEEE